MHIINKGIKRKNNEQPLRSSFNSNVRAISDPVEIASDFCNHFTNVGPTLANRIYNILLRYKIYLVFIYSQQ